MYTVIFIDTEVGPEENKVLDYGAAVDGSTHIHTPSQKEFGNFLVQNSTGSKRFACGHNIIHHDARYIRQEIMDAGITDFIDTLYLSPLLFPNKPYHALLKDDKLQTDSLNNPLNDSIKAMELFYDEVDAFQSLDALQKEIYADLLCRREEFRGFFSYMDYSPGTEAFSLIKRYYDGKICANANVQGIIEQYPVELAYVLTMISAKDTTSVIPNWINMKFPAVSNVIRQLRGTVCAPRCDYCRNELDVHRRLKQYFGYDVFRTYDGENLQEKAAQAAVDNNSLLAVFPTGGGKSITFQLPALMAGELMRALTVVISPLQSLMKDQVDNLDKSGIVDAVTINGLLSPIERAEAIERIEDGIASILYISPESLRSKTIERLLLRRNIARFVIDEAHCFSAWGQDFRVDYLYIGDFIKKLQEKKQLQESIPISCFTATAKQKVISDIKEYFKGKLGLDLALYTSAANRKNLRYEVLYKESDEEKYITLRGLIEEKNCPTIVYVSRTKRTTELADKLCEDGFRSLAFNGKMDKGEKQSNQDAFINDEVQVMVATSAFGMGVDKPNVGLVVHYDISDSLENYVQEAGRAGRDPRETFKLINILREENILANTKDLTAYIQRTDTGNKSLNVLKRYAAMEEFLVNYINSDGQYIHLKELNESAVNSGIKNATVNAFKTVLYYWTIKKYIKKSLENATARTIIIPGMPLDKLWEQRRQCIDLAEFIVTYLFEQVKERPQEKEQLLVGFSVLELKTEYMQSSKRAVSDMEIEDALLYLSKIEAMKLEGGFLVLYSGMQITRLVLDNKIRYKADDYKSLNAYYKQKMQQIHIVGEFANMMVRNYDEALQFVNAYFQMDYKMFIAKYFKGNRKEEINRNITPEKYNKLFRELSEVQREIIDDDTSKCIVVVAGPGSGKTKVLVHKLASLMLLEDVNLGFFKDKKQLIQRIPCGTKLLVNAYGLSVVWDGAMRPIVRFSQKFMEDIEKNRRQGYVMESASVRFVVGWMDMKEGVEYPIILPDVYFKISYSINSGSKDS